jgi:FtsH-binding integral membrane protein
MEPDTNMDRSNTRPELLRILCILSFIGSGISALSNLMVFLSFDQMDLIFDDLVGKFPQLEPILSGGKGFFISGFVLYAISLVGVFQMWKLRKIGFHLYTGAQFFILLLPVITLESLQVPFLSILITLAFVIAYSSQLKFMR